MKTILDKFDKKVISTLPQALFEGRIFVIFTESEADKAVDFLLRQSILGFDSETRPSFKKGKMYQVSLLQVATHDACFLFRLNRIGLTDSIVRLLEDNAVTKVGLSLQDDLHMLHLRRPFKAGSFIELQKEVKEIGITDNSLQKIYANLFGEKISKNQQLSNWDAETLTEGQKRYAATDAWACIKIHEEVARLKKEQNYKLVITAQPKSLDGDS